MCPHVLWDENEKRYRMWYSGGDQYEPNAIGYATSQDGITWERHQANPIFTPDRDSPWEKHKVTACQVIPSPPLTVPTASLSTMASPPLSFP